MVSFVAQVAPFLCVQPQFHGQECVPDLLRGHALGDRQQGGPPARGMTIYVMDQASDAG